ncbi:MAG: hypothetical protein ABSD28_10730 [Tepidisphaeraceae bacterium]
MTGKSQETLKWSLRIVVLTSMGLCIGIDVNRLFVKQALSKLSDPYALWDGWLEQATAPGRGIFLKFDDFPESRAGYAQNVYFRAVYFLYPQRVLVSGPSATLNRGQDLLKNNSLPSDQWLLDQGVYSVMSIVMDPKHDVPVVRDVRWLGK